MPTIFTRPPAYSAWNPAELAGPYDALTLREWEVAVATAGLAEQQRLVLLEALLEPATQTCERNWHWPLPRQIAPFDERFLCRASIEMLRTHLIEDAATLWQILDLPPAVIPGMLRGLLLVGLGARLRHTLAAFEGRPDALPSQRELEQALSALGVQVEPAKAPLPAQPDQQRARKRWWRGAA